VEHSEFRIGIEFLCNESRFRCTDVGTRTVVAIRIDNVVVTTFGADGGRRSRTIYYDRAESEGWFNGPPYAVVECVLDEDDISRCSLCRGRAVVRDAHLTVKRVVGHPVYYHNIDGE
jgi:hypothetical protein